MFKKAALLLVIVGVVISGIAYKQPADFKVTRSATMSAPPAAVFVHVNDLQKWNAWSPWAKLDPAAKIAFEGPASGPGAIMRWSGNNQVGTGKMTITQSRKNAFVQFRMEFLKPFAATHTSEFTFQPVGKETLVTWSMYGKNNFMAKVMGLFMNCDKIVGGQFEKGFASMKAIVEKRRQ